MNRKGLTLVELLASLAIVGMLTGACLAVVCRLGQSRQRLSQAEEQAGAVPQLIECLRADILHARQYRLTPGGFEIVGLSSIQPGSMQRRHLPVTVSYEVVTLNDANWLIRREVSTGGAARRELVCRGVAEISLFDPSQEDELDTTEYIDVPVVLAVGIVLEGDESGPVEHVLSFRSE